ncbi:unnamed protein product [Lota lota]
MPCIPNSHGTPDNTLRRAAGESERHSRGMEKLHPQNPLRSNTRLEPRPWVFVNQTPCALRLARRRGADPRPRPQASAPWRIKGPLWRMIIFAQTPDGGFVHGPCFALGGPRRERPSARGFRAEKRGSRYIRGTIRPQAEMLRNPISLTIDTPQWKKT